MKLKDDSVNFQNDRLQNPKISLKGKSTKSVFQNSQNVAEDFKIYQENFTEKSVKDSCVEKIVVKDENERKNRALRDKLVEQPCSSKEVSFPTCVTAIHKEPSVSSSSSCMSVQEQYNESDDVQVIEL